MKSGLVSLITLSWHHSLDLTIPFMDSLAAYNKDFELIIVDQQSIPWQPGCMPTDGAFLATRPWLKILRLIENSGFPRGNNLGLDECSGEIILIINNDVVVHGDILTLPRTFVEKDNETIVGMWLREHAGWNEFRQGNKYVHVPYLEGAYLMFHRSILDKIGGYLFDERFGKGGMEDVEFCRRAQSAGLKLCAIDLPLVHLGAKTTGDGRYSQCEITRANYEMVKEMVFAK